MSVPRAWVGYGRPSPTTAHARIPTDGEPEAERAVLRALQRSGVGGVTGLSCLIAAADLLSAVRAAHAPSSVHLHVVPGASTVHLEIDVTGFEGLTEAPWNSDDFPAARWGTVCEHGRTALWADVDRSNFDVETPSRFQQGEPGDPVEVLLDVTTRLARARMLGDIAAVVEGPLRDHLGANAAAVAMRDGATARLIRPEPHEGAPRSAGIGHPEQFSITCDLPMAASIRNGTTHAYPSLRLLVHDFPGAGEQLRADANDALVTVPVTVTGHPIGALAVGWRGTRPVDTVRPLLVIVAKHSAEAAIRVLSPPPGLTAMRPAGPRAPGAVPRTATATAIGGLRLDLVSRQVFVPGRSDPIRLTGREFELLHFLGEHAGTVQSRMQTLREVWGIDFRADTSVVDVTVSRLRRKLGPNVVVTVRDQGYMLRN